MDKPWLAHYPKEVPASYEYPRENVASFLVHSATSHPTKTAIWFYGKTITYEELLEHSIRFANAIRALPLEKGERVAIMLPNCPQAVIAYFGALLAGMTVVQHNPMYKPRELKHQLNDCGAKVLVVLDMLFPSVDEVWRTTAVRDVIVTSIRDYLPAVKSWLYPLQAKRQGKPARIDYSEHVKAWKAVLKDASTHMQQVDIDPEEDLALIQYTGGTTGIPKGAMLTHMNLVSNTMQSVLWSYQLRSGEERYLAVLPFFHVFGLTVCMNQAIQRTGTLILVPKFNGIEILRLIQRLRPTTFPGTPTMYIALLNQSKLSSFDLSSIEICVSGAAPLPYEVQSEFEKRTNGKIIEGYGLTEASPITHANNFWGMRKPGSIGIPMPDTDARIVDDEGRDVNVGEVGELIVRGPQVMKGYWNRSSENASVLRDGWLYTGDMARMDDDGFFYIMDRKKDIIIAGGFNIYPREIEEILYEHRAIAEVAVVGVPDEYRGETVKAFIQTKPGMHVSVEELSQWCRANLAAYKVPREFEFREALPKSAVGKILRSALIEEQRNA